MYDMYDMCMRLRTGTTMKSPAGIWMKNMMTKHQSQE